jgi:putative phosphoesterase
MDAPARIGLVADTHRRSGSTLDLPEQLLQELNGCDAIFHLGDFNAPGVLRALESIAPVYGVVGNNDEPELRRLLPEVRYVAVGARRLGLIHGHQAGRNARGAALATMAGDVDCAIYGHT